MHYDRSLGFSNWIKSTALVKFICNFENQFCDKLYQSMVRFFNKRINQIWIFPLCSVVHKYYTLHQFKERVFNKMINKIWIFSYAEPTGIFFITLKNIIRFAYKKLTVFARSNYFFVRLLSRSLVFFYMKPMAFFFVIL